MARGERPLTVIDGKMYSAAFKGEQRIGSVPIGLVLFNGVTICLFGELVLQFHGHDRQTIQKQAEIQRQQRIAF